MASSAIVSKLLNRLKTSNFSSNLQPLQNTTRTRSYSASQRQPSNLSKRPQKQRNNLFSRISPLGDPDLSLVPVLDQWVKQGKQVNQFELQRIIRNLRSRKRHVHALQVSEWMSSKGLCSFSTGDRAVQLDLIGRIRGIEEAESYFNKMNNEDKDEKVYGALLNCYVREGILEKALSLLQKMKELNFVTSPLTYNGIMCLYQNTGQFEKIPDVLSEMKKSGVSPDLFSYRICMNMYGAQSDITNMEKILEEMENLPHISMDWMTYASVANHYIKASLKEKALICMKKSEEKIDKDALGHSYLISLYASLGNKYEMIRLWNRAKSKCKKLINRDYITMLGSLVKLQELEETENILAEWDSSCQCYDFRVPNILLIGYCQQGLVDKAEAKLREIVSKGKTPTPNSWAIVAAGYLNKENMEKAYECMREALAVQAENKRWRPNINVTSSIVTWLSENKGCKEVEDFLSLLKSKAPIDRDMYHALIKAYIKEGKEVERVLERMRTDNIDVNEDTEKILGSR